MAKWWIGWSPSAPSNTGVIDGRRHIPPEGRSEALMHRRANQVPFYEALSAGGRIAVQPVASLNGEVFSS
jgi:hypothetical protein